MDCYTRGSPWVEYRVELKPDPMQSNRPPAVSPDNAPPSDSVDLDPVAQTKEIPIDKDRFETFRSRLGQQVNVKKSNGRIVGFVR